MQYKVSYNTFQKTVYIQEYDTPLKPDYSVLGLFDSDEIGTENSDIFYTQAQRLLNENGITDMANIRILTDLTNVVVAKPYKVAPALAVFDQQGNIVGFHSRTGQLIPINELALKVTGEENGVGIVTIDGNRYGLLPVNSNGEVQASIVNRTGTYDDLKNLAGSLGELAVTSDHKSILLYTGVANEAIELLPIGRINAAGANSYTMGHNALTEADAPGSVALGTNARAINQGEIVFGSATNYVQTRHVALSTRSTDIADVTFTTDGQEARGLENSIQITRNGYYDIEFTVIGREIGNNTNYARFVRRSIVRRNGATTTQIASSVTTPTPDINTGLAGAEPYAMASAGVFVLATSGVAGKTIQWSAFVTINEMSITV